MYAHPDLLQQWASFLARRRVVLERMRKARASRRRDRFQAAQMALPGV